MIDGKTARSYANSFNSGKEYLKDQELLDLIIYYNSLLEFFDIGVPNVLRLGLIVEYQGLKGAARSRNLVI